MALFDKIFDIAKTKDSLDEYLKYHMADINDFYNLPYEDLKQEIGFIELFILKKRQILRSLSYDKTYARSFLLILLDLCTRFNLLAATSTVHQIMIQHNIPCNKRMSAALAYIDPKPSSNDEYINRFTSICDLLESAIQEEEDSSTNSIATFLNYLGTVVQDTNDIYIKRIKEQIQSASSSATYQFINHPAIIAAIQIDTSDQERASVQIQTIVDDLLGNVHSDLKSNYKDTPSLIEDTTDYAEEIRCIGPHYKRIRKVSVDKSNGEAKTNRGVAILENEAELYEYMKRFGNMHKAKLDSALQSPFPQKWDQPINLYDWGCGQGIASMVFLEKYQTANINRVTLIEPSEIAISRAALHVSVYRPEVEIRTVCKKLDDLDPTDFNSSGADTHIHMFANILDIDDYSPSHLLELMDKAFPGVNYFVCTSPYIDDIKAERLNSFMRYFQNNYDSFVEISRATNQKIPGAIFWSCNNMYKGNPCDTHNDNALFCMNRWSRITRVFCIEK
mgnify:FL=1